LSLKNRVDRKLRDGLPRPVYHFARNRYYDCRTLARRNPGRGRLLPDFLIIGAAKSGTTTLHGWLSEHPFVMPAAEKEIHFFDYEYDRGVDWYRSHFPTKAAADAFAKEHGRPFLTGEASPSYISHQWAPARVAKTLPHVRLIVILRNPVDRAYSQFQMSRREGEEPFESFADALAAEESRLRPEHERMRADPRYKSWAIGCWSYMFRSNYGRVFDGDERWKGIQVPPGKIYAWNAKSTYVKNPPYFEGMTLQAPPVRPIERARVLALLGDSVTTDHISPAGNISKQSPAARYLMEQGVQPVDFNQYGARRGNHEVMMRGTFANIRLRNLLVPGTEGGITTYLPTGEQMSIYDAAMRYKADKTALLILAGKEYGTGSSRDWAAKGTMLLGVRAVIAESFERIHRSNLIGMGVLPLQYVAGQNAQSLGLSGRESYDIRGFDQGDARTAQVTASTEGKPPVSFEVRVRIDTPKEREYFRHGGILQYVLRQLAAQTRAA